MWQTAPSPAPSRAWTPGSPRSRPRPESRVIALAYTSSKAALTMLTTQYAKALTDIRVNTADPGYTATDLNGNTGPQTVTEGTDATVGLATEGPGHRSGRLVDRAGEITWT